MAVAAFAGDAAGLDVAAVVKADLAGSEAFRLVDSGSPPLPDDAPPRYADWRGHGTDAVLVGAVERQPAGQLRIRFMLHDAVRGSPVGGMELLADARSARSVGHRIADYVHEKLTGAPGVFSTRIAYVAKRPGRYELHVAEASGENPQIALASWHPIISPAWSPDGGRLAVVLTKDGTSQLYTIDADGTDLKMLAQSIGIDTEPCYSPDGRFVYFTSDRGGSPQIYRVPAAGGAPERLTFEGNYNVSPHLSPDGKTLAHIARTEAGFKLATLDLDTRQLRILTDSDADESPSFAPNGRLIALATTKGGQGILSLVSVDVRFRKQLAIAEGDLPDARRIIDAILRDPDGIGAVAAHVIDPAGAIIASSIDNAAGRRAEPDLLLHLEPVFRGDAAFVRPHRRVAGKPLVWFEAPVRAAGGKVIAALGLGFAADGPFARADIYALGAVAFNLLTGKRLFETETDHDLTYQVLHVKPRRASECAPAPIPPVLDELVARCVEKDPAARPQSVTEVADLLGRVLAQTPWTSRQIEAWWHQHWVSPEHPERRFSVTAEE